MKQIRCGCSYRQPGAACERGKTLFAAMTQAWQHFLWSLALLHGRGDECWAAFVLIRHAYRDHVNGWQEGNVKVQRERGQWMLSARWCGQWVLLMSTPEEGHVIEWLRAHSYEQFVCADAQQYCLAGYYRQQGREVEQHPFVATTPGRR